MSDCHTYHGLKANLLEQRAVVPVVGLQERVRAVVQQDRVRILLYIATRGLD